MMGIEDIRGHGAEVEVEQRAKKGNPSTASGEMEMGNGDWR
jgi:hypothetical protein